MKFIIIGSILFSLLVTSHFNNNIAGKAVDTAFIAVPDTHIVCRPPSRKSIISASSTTRPLHTTDHTDMVWIKGGAFQMGSAAFADSKPVHAVTVDGYWMDTHEVTNAQFEKFVQATGYITIAERPLNAKDYPGVPADKLVAGSAVFTPPTHKVSLDDPLQWWQYVAGVSWRHPKTSSDAIRANEPVVQVCYEDARAYAKWAGKQLPTEAEWEFAARTGKQNAVYYWGNELKPAGKWMANIFQGSFPEGNTKEDGFETLAPVKSFPANAFGLYDMEGNVWEWCADLYRPGYDIRLTKKNPTGPATSFDPDEPGVVKHVQRGGSFLCSDEYCIRYRAGSRGKGETSSASNNLGFRCISR